MQQLYLLYLVDIQRNTIKVKLSILLQIVKLCFHAGTKRDDDGLYTNGGRVVAATCYGNSMDDALKSSYELLANISFDKMTYRKDIGQDLKNY